MVTVIECTCDDTDDDTHKNTHVDIFVNAEVDCFGNEYPNGSGECRRPVIVLCQTVSDTDTKEHIQV